MTTQNSFSYDLLLLKKGLFVKWLQLVKHPKRNDTILNGGMILMSGFFLIAVVFLMAAATNDFAFLQTHHLENPQNHWSSTHLLMIFSYCVGMCVVTLAVFLSLHKQQPTTNLVASLPWVLLVLNAFVIFSTGQTTTTPKDHELLAVLVMAIFLGLTLGIFLLKKLVAFLVHTTITAKNNLRDTALENMSAHDKMSLKSQHKKLTHMRKN